MIIMNNQVMDSGVKKELSKRIQVCSSVGWVLCARGKRAGVKLTYVRAHSVCACVCFIVIWLIWFGSYDFVKNWTQIPLLQ